MRSRPVILPQTFPTRVATDPLQSSGDQHAVRVASSVRVEADDLSLVVGAVRHGTHGSVGGVDVGQLAGRDVVDYAMRKGVRSHMEADHVAVVVDAKQLRDIATRYREGGQ
jgi:hypothetical protein